MGLRENTDGNRDTQLSEQNYARRTSTRSREAKNMKNYSENRKNGLYEPENAIFWLFFRFLEPPGMKFWKNESVEQAVPAYGAQGAPSAEP